jgi:hypothetical protein
MRPPRCGRPAFRVVWIPAPVAKECKTAGPLDTQPLARGERQPLCRDEAFAQRRLTRPQEPHFADRLRSFA